MLEGLVVQVGQHEVSPSAIARAEALEEAAVYLESIKQARRHSAFRGCFGFDADEDGWENLSFLEKDALKSAAEVLRKMARKQRGIKEEGG
jgi:hypothetical protein